MHPGTSHHAGPVLAPPASLSSLRACPYTPASSLLPLLPLLLPLLPAQQDKVYRSMGLDKQDFLSKDDFTSFIRAQPEYLALALASQVCRE